MASKSFTRCCSQLSSARPSTSAARAFLQLTPRRPIHTAPLLDFLVPSCPFSRAPHKHPKKYANLRPPARSFTTSFQRQTCAIVNARKDEDGQDMSVEITPRASKRLKEIMAKDANPDLALRIQVESGGCHGFQYLMSLTTLPPLSSSPNELQEETSPALNTSSSDPNAIPTKSAAESTGKLDEDDTVFAAEDGTGAKVVMDGPSLELLKGSKIDYTMELIGSQFKIVDNPLATSSCGCGTSFDIKA